MNNKRIAAFVIDYIITALIMDIPFFILVIRPILHGNNVNLILQTLVSCYIALLYLLFRDVPSSCSVGKKIVKLHVIDVETKRPAGLYKKILRNSTWLLLAPVEIIAYLFFDKRIGDRIAKTEVVPLY